MDGLLPWYCYNDVGAYRAVAPCTGMVRWHAVGESRSGKGIRAESFFASLALFLPFTVSVRLSGSDDAISGDLNWMFDSLFDVMACSGRCCRVTQLNFFGLVVLAQPCTVLIGRSVSDAPLDIQCIVCRFCASIAHPTGELRHQDASAIRSTKKILQENERIHYSTTIWFSNSFLCLKL